MACLSQVRSWWKQLHSHKTEEEQPSEKRSGTRSVCAPKAILRKGLCRWMNRAVVMWISFSPTADFIRAAFQCDSPLKVPLLSVQSVRSTCPPHRDYISIYPLFIRNNLTGMILCSVTRARSQSYVFPRCEVFQPLWQAPFLCLRASEVCVFRLSSAHRVCTVIFPPSGEDAHLKSKHEKRGWGVQMPTHCLHHALSKGRSYWSYRFWSPPYPWMGTLLILREICPQLIWQATLATAWFSCLKPVQIQSCVTARCLEFRIINISSFFHTIAKTFRNSYDQWVPQK